MKLKRTQIAELAGIIILLGSTAMQLFYLEPLKREIEWRLVAFNVQQVGQVQTTTQHDAHISLLQTLKAPDERIKAAQAERDRSIEKFKTADANISDFLIEKERVEDYLEWIVIALFAFGSLLAGGARLFEIRATQQQN